MNLKLHKFLLRGGELGIKSTQGKVYATFEWADGNAGTLLLSDIERTIALAAEGLAKKAGKPIDKVTYEFKGKEHVVKLAKVRQTA